MQPHRRRRGAAAAASCAAAVLAALLVAGLPQAAAGQDVVYGVLTTIAGNGSTTSQLYPGDGQLGSLSGIRPTRLAVSWTSPTSVLITDSSAHRIRRVSLVSKLIDTFGGTGVAGWNGDNLAARDTRMSSPQGIAFDTDGGVIFADFGCVHGRGAPSGRTCRVVSPAEWSHLALSWPRCVPRALAHSLLPPTTHPLHRSRSNNRVRKIAPSTTVVTTLCGNGQGTSTGDTGPAWAATVSGPRDVAVDDSGNVYVVESGTGRLRLIIKDDGSIRTLLNAAAITPIAVSIRAMAWNPSSRRLIVADDQRGVILSVSPSDGSFTRVAGGGRLGWDTSIFPNVFVGYTPPLSTDIRAPSGLAVDASGRIYVSATSVNMIYMIADNQVQPIAGSYIGQAGFAGDAGLAVEGLFSAPAGLAVTRDKSRLFVADTGNARVRQITQEPLPNGGFTPSNTRTPARTPSATRSRTSSNSPTKSRSVAATRSRTKKKKVLRL